MIRFQYPWVIAFLPLIAALIFICRRRQKNPSIQFSTLKEARTLARPGRVFFSRCLFGLRVLALLLFFISLVGPERMLEEASYRTEGIDIMLAVDVSGSMAAEDFRLKNKRVNRLDVVKDVAKEFIQRRRHDRIGIVAFAGEAYTVCPLTLDQDWLIQQLDRLDLGLMRDGTAIGYGIASSLNRLRESSAKSKVVILLTDGVNNTGTISPTEAAYMARALEIPIYTIGVGSQGPVPFPMTDAWGRRVYRDVEIDYDAQGLEEIAQMTQGKFFEAADTEALRAIYTKIDELEKAEIIHTGYRLYEPLFGIFLLWALGILAVDIILSRTWLLRIP